MSDTKTCRTCNETKPETDFYVNQRLRDGLMHQCKRCVLAGQKRVRDQQRIITIPTVEIGRVRL